MSNLSEDTVKLRKGAVWYAQNEWKVIPCHGIVAGRCTCGQAHPEPKDKGKHPVIADWNRQASSNTGDIEYWWDSQPDANVGVNCHASGFFVIDIDPRSGGIESFDKFLELLDTELPPTVEAYTGEYSSNGKVVRGRHIFFKCDLPTKNIVGNLKASGLNGIDIKYNGYVLIAPSRHFSGVNYEWREGHAPWEIQMAEAPEELLAAIKKGSAKSGTAVGTGDWNSIFGNLDLDGKRLDIDKLLQEGITEGSRAVDIYALTCALANKFPVDTEAGRMGLETLMIRFNAEKVTPPLHLEGQGGLLSHVRRAIDFVLNNPKMDRTNPEVSKWMKDRAQRMFGEGQAPVQQAVTQNVETYSDNDDYNIEETTLPGTIGGSVFQGIENGKSVYEASSNGNIDVPGDPDALREEDGGQVGKRTLSDTGNGRRLVDVFGQGIRYTPGLSWFQWDGNYWKPDSESLGVTELAKRLAPIIASEVEKYEDNDKRNEVVKWAQQSKSNGRINASIESANSDPRVYVDVNAWDADPYLLGVLNGVVDLRTGEILRGRPDLHITRRAPVAYNPGLQNVRWNQFLDYATGGDKELQDWLQRAAGYTLTGLRKYDVMFLVYGPAGSGKNTLVEAIVKCLGTQEYAWPMDSSILAANDGQANGSDLYHWAMIRGRRMVWVDELPDSERLKENSVKKLTGSSEISARSPGESPFTFQSQAKLWVTTNHRPIITDDAMWRRIRPIPLLRPPEKPDPDLKEYIFDPEGALSAVLSWAVEGAIKLNNSSERDALGWCTAVKEAADVYQKNEDRLGLFLSEETNESEGAATPVKGLYAVYRMWSEERGERPMTQIAFQKKLVERNIDLEGVGSRAIVKGYSLAPRAVQQPGSVDWSSMQRFAR